MRITRNILLMLLMLLPGVVTFAEDRDDAPGSVALTGSGTANDPFKIGTFEELDEFRKKVKGGGTAYCAQLTSNIDAPQDNTWYGIGIETQVFTGTFDGNQHTISGLKYVKADYPGSFGFVSYLGSGGVIKNLILKDCSFSCPSTSGLGGVCGQSYQGVINHCAFVDGSLTNNDANGVTGVLCGNMTGGSVNFSYSTKTEALYTNAAKFGTIAGVADAMLAKKCFSMVYEKNPNLPLVGQGTSVEYSDSEGNVAVDRFASGEVTWMLSTGEKDTIWTQNLKDWHAQGSSNIPVFKQDTVYKYGDTKKELKKGRFTTCWYLKDIILEGGVKAYKATAVNNDIVKLESVAKCETNTSYVLYAETDGYYELPVCFYNYRAVTHEKRVKGNLMVGQVEGKNIVSDADTTRYVLQTQNDKQAMYRVSTENDKKVTAVIFKCYMELPVNPKADADARSSLQLSFDEETAVDEVTAEPVQAEGVRYNLQGQRVKGGLRGIYIQDGKLRLMR